MRVEVEKDLLRLNPGRSTAKGRRKYNRTVRARYKVIALRSFVWFAGLAFVFYFSTWALKPHCDAWLVNRGIPLLELREAQARQRRVELDWQIGYAQSDKGSKSLAREFGYLERGEVPFVAPQDVLKRTSSKTANQPKLSHWDRFMFFLCRICGAEADKLPIP